MRQVLSTPGLPKVTLLRLLVAPQKRGREAPLPILRQVQGMQGVCGCLWGCEWLCVVVQVYVGVCGGCLWVCKGMSVFVGVQVCAGVSGCVRCCRQVSTPGCPFWGQALCLWSARRDLPQCLTLNIRQGIHQPGESFTAEN